jgi:hypothetical protein
MIEIIEGKFGCFELIHNYFFEWAVFAFGDRVVRLEEASLKVPPNPSKIHSFFRNPKKSESSPAVIEICM